MFRSESAMPDEPVVPEVEPTLTPRQIENWRKVLLLTIGPYALLMPDEEVIKYCRAMQQSLKKYDSGL